MLQRITIILIRVHLNPSILSGTGQITAVQPTSRYIFASKEQMSPVKFFVVITRCVTLSRKYLIGVYFVEKRGKTTVI